MKNYVLQFNTDLSHLPRITISGPGGVINHEYYVIRQALIDAGFEIAYEDNACPDDPALLEKIRKDRNLKIKVCLLANHVPWGG